MSKPILNNRINYQDIIGRVIAHDTYFNQPVKVSSSPTFANLYLTGDIDVAGNLYVAGNSTIFSSEIIEFSDNIILVNNTETNYGVSLQYAGIEIERGLGENFRIVFNEATDRLECGFLSSLAPVALLDNSLVDQEILIWDNSSNKIKTINNINIPITFGNLQITDTLYFQTGNLNSTNGILKLTNSDFSLDFDQKLILGNLSQSIYSDSLTGDLHIDSGGDIYFSNTVPKKIHINGEVPITFSTADESIYADFANNMTITSSQDIFLYPNKGLGGNRVFVPYDTKVSFGDSGNFIYSDTIGNLNISSTSIIQDLKFGNSKVYSTNGNKIIIKSGGVNFGTIGNVFLVEDTIGNLTIDTNDLSKRLDIKTETLFSNDIFFPNTYRISFDNTSVQFGSTNGSFLEIGTNIIGKNTSNTLYTIDNSLQQTTYQNQKFKITTIDNNAFNITDSFTINTTQQKVYSDMNIIVTNTTESTDISNGSLMVLGGVAIQKNLNVLGNTNFSNNVNLDTNRITNLGEPINSSDAATKNYVDAVKQGLYVKDSVEAATTVNINLVDLISGYTIDGFVLSNNDRILVKNQTNSVENGIYVVTSSGGIRSNDFNTGVSAAGFFCFVKEGSINKNLGWICNSSVTNDVVDTDNLTFTQFTGLGQITPGSGLSKTFNQLDVKVDDFSIGFQPVTTNLRIKSDTLGTGLTGGNGAIISVLSDLSHVTKLGIISTGTWNSDIITVPYGGTGLNYISSGSILYGNGGNPLSSSSLFVWNNSLETLEIGGNTYINKDSLIIGNGQLLQTSGSFILGDTNDIKIKIGSITNIQTNTSGTFIYNNLIITNGNLTVSGNVQLNGTLSTLYTTFVDTSSELTLYRGTTSNLILSDTNLILDNILIGNTNLYKNITSDLEIDGNIYISNQNQISILDNSICISNTNGTSISTTITSNNVVLSSTSGSLLQLNLETKLGESVIYTPGITEDNLLITNNLKLTVDTPINYTGNRKLDVFKNTSTSGTLWYYAGIITSGNIQYTLDDNNSKSLVGIYFDQWTNIPEIKCTYYGSTISNTITQIYNDTSGNYHLFFLTKQDSFSNLSLDYNNYPLILTNEGVGNEPNGIISNYNPSWTLLDTSKKLTNLYNYESSQILISEGNDTGLFIERNSDNIANNDTSIFTDTIPSQVVLAGNLSILKLSSSANSLDDFYNNYTILFTFGILTGETRKIIKYNGAQRLAYLNIPLTSVPDNGDSVDFFNNNYFVTYLDESNGKLTSGYTTKKENVLTLNKYGDYLIGNLQTNDGITTGGMITINSTSINSIFSLGGAYFGKEVFTPNLYVNDSINFNTSNIILKDTIGSLKVQNGNNQTILVFNSIGNISLQSSIVNNTTYGNIGIHGGIDSNNTSQSRIVINSNDLSLYSGTIGSIILNDSLDIDYQLVSIGTKVLINDTTQATSFTNGGALTVDGGGSIGKDVYIGGDLYVGGSFSSGDTVSQPTLSESNLVNCSFDSYGIVYMVKNGIVRNLFFTFTLTPNISSELCEVQFNIPDKLTAFSTYSEVISGVSAFVDTTELIQITNIVCTSLPGTNRIIIKFQSNTLGTHYFQANLLFNTT